VFRATSEKASGVDLRNSVSTFENFQHEREKMLTRSAELLADLPLLAP